MNRQRSPGASSASAPRAVLAFALALCVAHAAAAPAPSPASAPASTPAPAASAAPLTAAQAEAAFARLRADPLLPGMRRERFLRWKPDDTPEKPRDDDHALRDWFARLGDAIANASRLLVYGLGLVVIAVTLVGGRHLLLARRDAGRLADAARVVSHVGALDVRPGSLPEDIGARARALWDGGDAGAALSLLYRGALSRLIHRFDVPLDDASTEGESLALARPRVATATHAWLAVLVGAWQSWRYGGRRPPDETVHALCDGFDAHLRGDAA